MMSDIRICIYDNLYVSDGSIFCVNLDWTVYTVLLLVLGENVSPKSPLATRNHPKFKGSHVYIGIFFILDEKFALKTSHSFCLEPKVPFVRRNELECEQRKQPLRCVTVL